MIGMHPVGPLHSTWKSVVLGNNNFKTVNDLCLFCDGHGCEVVVGISEGRLNGLMVGQDLRNITFHLVAVSRSNLGLTEEASFADICDRGEELGLTLCPNKIPFYVAAGYKHLRHKEKYVFVTQSSLPLGIERCSRQIVFSLNRTQDGVRELVVMPDCPPSASKFVFVHQMMVSS